MSTGNLSLDHVFLSTAHQRRRVRAGPLTCGLGRDLLQKQHTITTVRLHRKRTEQQKWSNVNNKTATVLQTRFNQSSVWKTTISIISYFCCLSPSESFVFWPFWETLAMDADKVMNDSWAFLKLPSSSSPNPLTLNVCVLADGPRNYVPFHTNYHGVEGAYNNLPKHWCWHADRMQCCAVVTV